MRRRDHNLIHGDLKQCAEGIKVIDAGQALSLLPFVDGLGRIKAEKLLKIVDGQASLLPQPGDVCAGGHRVDYWKPDLSHK